MESISSPPFSIEFQFLEARIPKLFMELSINEEEGGERERKQFEHLQEIVGQGR